MNKEYYMEKEGLVLLKKDAGQIWQYSFKARVWYNVNELKGIENHPELVTKISEEEAQNFIEQVENMLENAKPKKIK